jgi:hypothetical protein
MYHNLQTVWKGGDLIARNPVRLLEIEEIIQVRSLQRPIICKVLGRFWSSKCKMFQELMGQLDIEIQSYYSL